jgi:spoIIIJ-associated protein
MIKQEQIKQIKKTAEDFFNKMTIFAERIDAVFLAPEDSEEKKGEISGYEKEVVNLNIFLEEPQILIGQGGQTLSEIQRLLRMILNKQLGDVFYLNLDINDYKKKKIEYLKSFSKELADEVAFTKKEKALSPMSSYERRIIHAELAKRTDVATESHGTGNDRHIVILPK